LPHDYETIEIAINDKGIPWFGDYADANNGGFKFDGRRSGEAWILPSLIKPLDSSQFIILWRQALQAIRNSDEIVVVGYSLPGADSTARLMFAGTNIENKILTIVDPNSNVCDTFSEITGNTQFNYFETVEAYLNKSTDLLY